MNSKHILAAAITAPLLLVNATSAFAVADKVALCHKEGSNYSYLEVASSAVSAHLGHGDFQYAGPAGTDTVKDAWCQEHAPKLTVPEFGLSTALVAIAVSAGGFFLLRTRFA